MSQRYMPTHMPRVCHLPLTPPEMWGPSAYTAPGPLYNTGGYYGPIGYQYRPNQDPRDNSRRQSQFDEHCELPPVAAPPYANAHGHEFGYEAQAPILPPIRIPENIQGANQTSHQVQSVSQPTVQEQVKEEKVAGGVAASLTYKMEQMIDFVAEMAQGMYDLSSARFCFADIDVSRSVQPSVQVTPAFRKYVSQILTSTRLPSSTIMLALHYLATRMSILQSRGHYASTSGHLYQMLTTGLMLASKFLDDNTFQNRSWAEVSHIAVIELNKHEVEWLLDIHWNLHFDVEDPLGFKAWFERWERYAEARKITISMEALKITPLDPVRMTQSAHPRYMPQTPLYTPPSYECTFSSTARERSQPWQQWGPLRTSLSPPAALSHLHTPEWYQHNITGFGQHSAAYSTRPLPPLQIMPSAHSQFYDYPSQQYTPSPWTGHMAGCGCGYCAMGQERYSMAHNFGVQSVAA